MKEFGVDDDGKPTLKVGDTVEVFLERVENALGEAVISREKARREEAWTRLEGVYARQRAGDGLHRRPREGRLHRRPRRRLGLPAGLAGRHPPGARRRPADGPEQPFAILKMDRPRGNIVVSRRAILEEARAEQRTELVSQLHEGEVREGVVKNITDYGAFVDLGGIDGLLHVTDMSWKRVSHPSQVLAVGDTVKVQIVKINPDTQRISLGMKQLQSDPWDGVEAKYPVGAKFTGRITNITDYGAFVELEAGVEGLVHVSEMSWTKKNVHPGKIVSTSQEVEVVVLDVDASKRRVSAWASSRPWQNPWEAVPRAAPDRLDGRGRGQERHRVRPVHRPRQRHRRHGPPVRHRLERARRRSHRRATRRARWSRPRCSTSTSRRSASRLGIKQLAGDPMAGDIYRKGQTVTVTVTEITSGGIEVKFGDDEAPMTAFIRKSDLSRDRSEQRPERFAVGDRLDAQITNVDKAARRVSLSVKALEMAEEKEAIEKFGSSDSGASLGDILGAALREKASKE